MEGKGPQFKVGHVMTGPAGPLYVDLDARLEAMNGQGVAVHAMSLSQPMSYWADRELGEKLRMPSDPSRAKVGLACWSEPDTV